MLRILACLILLGASLAPGDARATEFATLYGKLVVGFQGWFMCPNDGRPHGGWVHWFSDNSPDPAHVHFDLLADVAELTPAERCPTGLRTADGRPVELFSDQNPLTVQRQFDWMRQYGIESVALQRFILAFAPSYPAGDRAAVERVLANVRTAAEQTGRGFFVMYDIAGADQRDWATNLAEDWQRLIAAGVVSSPAYQRHKGKPVLAIAGVGSADRPGTAEQTQALLDRLRHDSAAVGGVTLLGTTATGWRTLDGDSKQEPGWASVYRSFDILSPWTVGRYVDAASFARFRAQRLLPDEAEARRLGIDYMPVIFPGFSWRNLTRQAHRGEEVLDKVPRRCGQFLWSQAAADTADGARMLYGAMFDEVDEGTALFKLVPNPADLPAQPPLVPLASPDCQVRSDWYLRIAGRIGDLLRGASAEAQVPLPRP